jgi:hypothetical protein
MRGRAGWQLTLVGDVEELVEVRVVPREVPDGLQDHSMDAPRRRSGRVSSGPSQN